jgi:hypothetical protein
LSTSSPPRSIFIASVPRLTGRETGYWAGREIG